MTFGTYIININYSSEEKDDVSVTVTYMNATYDEKTGEFADVWNSGEKNWQDSDYGGKYFDALTPDIAVYK